MERRVAGDRWAGVPVGPEPITQALQDRGDGAAGAKARPRTEAGEPEEVLGRGRLGLDRGTRDGWLLGVDRAINTNFRVGLGYNFTDFSGDMTNLDYDHRGWFLNFVGTY